MSWITLKGAIIGQYGVPKEQLRFEKIREILGCVKLETESVDGFLERFKFLKTKLEVTDRYVIAKVFFDAFPKSISRIIMVAMIQVSESTFYDLDYVSVVVAQRIDRAMDKKISLYSGGPGKKRSAEVSELFLRKLGNQSLLLVLLVLLVLDVCQILKVSLGPSLERLLQNI